MKAWSMCKTRKEKYNLQGKTSFHDISSIVPNQICHNWSLHSEKYYAKICYMLRAINNSIENCTRTYFFSWMLCYTRIALIYVVNQPKLIFFWTCSQIISTLNLSNTWSCSVLEFESNRLINLIDWKASLLSKNLHIVGKMAFNTGFIVELLICPLVIDKQILPFCSYFRIFYIFFLCN